MKKNSLFKVILIVLGAFMLVDGILALLGYVVPGLENKFTIIPIGDVFINFIQSFYYFFDTVVYLLVLGAFYSVINEVPAYKKLLDNIVTKVKAHSKLFVVIVTILFAILTSVTGLVNVLLVFVPFIIAIILLLGYDKLVAISSTVVAMLIGLMSSIFLTFRDPSSYYGYAASTFEKLVGIDAYTNMWPKLILLLLGTALLVFFINRHIKSVQDKKVKYDLNDNNEVVISEVKGDYKNIKTWPIIVILSIIFIALILGYLPWNTLFGIECFDKFDEWLLGLKIGEFSIFANIISNSAANGSFALGNWSSLGSYMSIIITLIVFTIIIKLVYKVKFNEVIDNFMSGAKKMLSTVFLVMLTFDILVCTYNHGFMSTLITLISESKLGVNIVSGSFITALGTLLHTDLYYTIAGVFTPLLATITDESMQATYAMTFQSIYGLVSIITPTSLLLIFVLKYFDVPYTTWVKYIWRFVLMLLLLVILILLVLSLI